MSVVTNVYNQMLTDQWSKLINFANGGDTFKVALYNSSGTFSATDTTYSTTNELATSGGYTQGGIALTNQAISGTTSKKWTADPSVWTSSSAGFTAYYAKIYDTSNSNHLIAHIDFGGAQPASGGGTFTITWDTNGIISVG